MARLEAPQSMSGFISEIKQWVSGVLPTKASLGMGNVENKSSATIRGELTKSDVTSALGYTPPQSDTNTTYTLTQNAGDGHKLTLTGSDGTSKTVTIPDNNTTYTLDSLGIGNVKDYDQSKAIKSITRSGTTFTYECLDGTTGTFTQQDSNTWTAMTGATSSTNGKAGYVPAPPKDGYNTKYLRADGSWTVPPDTTYSAGTGLSLDGTTINHSNSTTPKTLGSMTDTIGKNIYIPYLSIDSEGHIKGGGTSIHTVSGFLTAHQTVKQDGVIGATVNRYGVCATAAGSAAKTVAITSGTFSLEAGARVTIKFNNANTAANPTLNVNSTGAKSIFRNGEKITYGGRCNLLFGVCDFVYDGAQYHILSNDSDSVPIGTIIDFAGMTIPLGYLECDGGSVSRTTYAKLFAVIGTYWGEGDGSTTFTLPNLTGRVTIGQGGDYGLSGTGGEATHILSVNEMPSHSHGAFMEYGAAANSAYGIYDGLSGTYNQWGRYYKANKVAYTGEGAAHNNMQPYAVVRKLIKAYP